MQTPKRAAKGIVVLFMLLLTVACGLAPYVAVFEEWDYSFNDGGIQFASLDDLLAWVHGYISYTTDSELWGWTEYWDSPESVFNQRKGDCDAYALLFMYFAYSRNFSENPQMAGVALSASSGHALVRIGGRYYDPAYIAVHDHNA